MTQQIQHEANRLDNKNLAQRELAQKLEETRNTCDLAYCRRVLRSVPPMSGEAARLLQSRCLE